MKFSNLNKRILVGQLEHFLCETIVHKVSRTQISQKSLGRIIFYRRSKFGKILENFKFNISSQPKIIFFVFKFFSYNNTMIYAT